MDYQLEPQEIALQQDIAAFCRAEIAPRAAMLDGCSRLEAGQFMAENIRRLGGAGWLGKGHGPASLDLAVLYLIGEEIAKACPATFLSTRASAFLCAGALELFGTPSQKERFVPGLLKGELVGAFAYSEAQAGSDMAGIVTVAGRDGDAWFLNGKKDIVVNAPIADIIIVLAYCDATAGAEKGMGLFIVEKGAEGLLLSEAIETMGMRGVPISSMSMSACAASGLLGGEPGQGYAQVRRILSMGAVGIAALCVGIGTACMEISTAHAKERTAFGRKIGMYQDVGFKLADMFAGNDLGRMLALRAAWAFNTGEADADVRAACAKLFAGEAVNRIANWGMQIFAGHGYLAGSDIERVYRDARFGEICEGTSEMLRSTIAATELDRFKAA